MQIKKLVLVAVASVMTLALFGCPEKAADPKPDPAASAKKPTTTAPAAATAAPKAGGGW